MAAAAADIIRRLIDICGPAFARLAGAADVVAGRPAHWVALPGDPGAAAKVLRLAAAHDLTVVPRGAGTKIDWGAAPEHVDIMLDTGRLAGVGHRPGARVATIGAGTPLRAAQAILAGTGHRLTLDAPSPDATVGGVLAADEAGPLRHRHGSPSQQLVAMSYLTADGELISTGGDASGPGLARLLHGSRRGRGGVLVSATLPVQPLPASRAWVTRPVESPAEADTLAGLVRAAPVAPAAVELDLMARASRARPTLPADDPAAVARARHPSMFQRTLPPSAVGTLAILLEGDPADVSEQADCLLEILGEKAAVQQSAPPWWGSYPFGPDDTALRIEVPAVDLRAGRHGPRVRVGDLRTVALALCDVAGNPVAMRGCAGQGILHAVLPGALPADQVASIVTGVRQTLLCRCGRCVVVAAPPAVRSALGL
ncbi:FAD-binding oxidoreductase [Micromonospora sp. DT233]|uniref:FAD-binding oxidoreductase n=1 Tax=Micromonospora sp. DT233 TaxID=3393432 RepID=UPI003CEF4B9F